jgi:cation diffusion facilitator family transporter
MLHARITKILGYRSCFSKKTIPLLNKIADMPYADKSEIYRVTFVGFVINVILTIFKYIAGITGRSAAMIADATHSLSDLVSDIIVLIFVRIATKPVDENHRYGHGKFETFSTFVVGMILGFAGIGILWDAGAKIFQQISGHVVSPPERIALIAAGISIVIKEMVFWYTLLAARRHNSQILKANAWHHRTDALSSVATLLGIGGAMYFGGKWQILDPIAAALVSVLILRVAYKIVIPAVNDLLEKSLPPSDRKEICKIIRSVDQVQNPHGLRTRRIGNHFAIEIHVCIDKHMTVEDSHELTLVVERKLKEKFGDETHVVIHVDPA